ncbi:ABC transporter substrate-binding protein [Mesorhizobium australicum]|uniref:Amino acid/amide ABC transporter substrate-binding protein, HAAT family n=1 Tax=Mesorhizobium australicum TaxID=536018 RepID=A0A1X7MTR2_9HYPH|nr:ABC transporter substrate-binding protein [Mesorhizobium australicum]SMH27721.1 amino acid/amide ABC transporter substrate-binding protein, HAAT family [Mesorhizobium australicum]
MDMTRRSIVASLGAGAVTLALPAVLRAQHAPVKIGLIHPVSGAVAFSGQQCRLGATMAVEDLNSAGGIKALGGAQIEALLGDAQSRPEIGASLVEQMAEQGVAGFTGAYSTAVSLAATQAAAKYDIPFSLDGPTGQLLTERGLRNVFRLFPSNASLVKDAIEALNELNTNAGSPAKTAILIHEDGEFGTNTANLVSEQLPTHNITVVDRIAHATPTRDFTNVALRVKSAAPDLIIITSYANEYVLLARSLVQQRVNAKAIFSISGAGFNLKFIQEQPTIAAGIIDFNNWYNPIDPRSREFRQRVETSGNLFTWEVLYGYFAVKVLADAIERAGSTDKERVIDAFNVSQYSDHFLPFGPTNFVDGQNQGARMLCLQAQNGDIRVVGPKEYQEIEPIFPRETL